MTIFLLADLLLFAVGVAWLITFGIMAANVGAIRKSLERLEEQGTGPGPK